MAALGLMSALQPPTEQHTLQIAISPAVAIRETGPGLLCGARVMPKPYAHFDSLVVASNPCYECFQNFSSVRGVNEEDKPFGGFVVIDFFFYFNLCEGVAKIRR